MSTKRAVYDIASFKAAADENGHRGQFEALVSVFNNIDFQGDRVLPGAFQKSLTKWRKAGNPIPLIWSHDWGDPHAHIGKADPDDVEETAEGLVVKGTIDLDNPFAAQVYRLLKERRVREFSFGYAIKKERKAEDGANELVDLDIIEAGPTLKGANPDTALLGVKADLEAAAVETKVGRRISRATELELSALADEAEVNARANAAFASRIRGLLSVQDSQGDSEEEKESDEADASGKATVDPDLLTLNALILTVKE